MKSPLDTLNRILLYTLFTVLTVFVAQAGKRIDGNGQLTVKKKLVEQFYQIEVGTFCNVVVYVGAMPLVSFKVDENLHDYYTVKVMDGVLKINAKEWPEPTDIQVTIQVPFITAFTHSGWGKVQINQLKTKHFQLTAETGTVQLNGVVETLDILAGGGFIDAEAMQASSIQLTQDGHGITKLGKTSHLDVSGALAKVYTKETSSINRTNADKSLKIYNERGQIISTNKTSQVSTTVQYIDVSIKNNSLAWNSFVIRGPKSRNFSYGFSMFPYTTKSERIPVGTTFYKESFSGKEQKVVVIKAADAGKTVNLFE